MIQSCAGSLANFQARRGPGHDVEIIEVVAVRGADRVIAARHQHRVAVADRHRLVEAAVVGIDALERESLRRRQAVVIGFLEQRLRRPRRRGRACAADSSTSCRPASSPRPPAGFRPVRSRRQDVADVARVGARPARFAPDRSRPGSARTLPRAGAGRGADRDFGVVDRGRSHNRCRRERRPSRSARRTRWRGRR